MSQFFTSFGLIVPRLCLGYLMLSSSQRVQRHNIKNNGTQSPAPLSGVDAYRLVAAAAVVADAGVDALANVAAVAAAGVVDVAVVCFLFLSTSSSS